MPRILRENGQKLTKVVEGKDRLPREGVFGPLRSGESNGISTLSAYCAAGRYDELVFEPMQARASSAARVSNLYARDEGATMFAPREASPPQARRMPSSRAAACRILAAKGALQGSNHAFRSFCRRQASGGKPTCLFHESRVWASNRPPAESVAEKPGSSRESRGRCRLSRPTR